MKVRAKNDDIRKVLKHPIGGRFREDGTAEWPDDSFTYRRIQDGDIVSEEPARSEPIPPPAEPKKSKAKEA